MGATRNNVYAFPSAKVLPPDEDIVEADIVTPETPNLPAVPQARTPWPNRAAREAEKTTELVPAKPKLIERYAERAPKVLTPGRFDAEAPALRKRVAVTTTKFLLFDIELATARGFALTVRAWWRWMLLADEREAAISDGKFANRAKDIREARTKRVKGTLIGLVVLAVALIVFLTYATATLIMAAGIVTLFGLFSYGFEWRRPRKTIISSKSTVWAGSVDGLRRALIDAKLMKEEQDLRLVKHPHQVGKGVAAVVDLPPGLSVAKVVQNKAAVASALAVDAAFLSLEKGAHDGQLNFWAASGDPFTGGSPKLPLITAQRWNAWHPAPFGRTPREQDVPLRLVYSNMLLGAKPGAGKTFAARCAVAPYILDPAVRIFAANGKPDPAWDAIAQVAVQFIRGRRDEQAMAVNAMLQRVIDEMDDRFINHMTGSKVTEQDGLPLVLVVIDELQNYTANGMPCEEKLRGKAATLGEHISAKLVDIIKNGRAAGVILVMATQKPSEQSLPTELRSQIGTRWAGKVMDYHTSNMILGSNLSTQGYDASQIATRHRGLGILVPDMEEDILGEELDEFPRVRTYLCDDADWNTMCARGRELRIAEGTLEGEADGEKAEPILAPGELEGEIVEQALPDLLETIFDFCHALSDGDRLSTNELVQRFEPESNTKVLGGQLRRWGAPTGRTGGRGASGPLVGDIRRAVERIRSGGPENVLDTVH